MKETGIQLRSGNIYRVQHSAEEVERFVDDALATDCANVILKRAGCDGVVSIVITKREDVTVLSS